MGRFKVSSSDGCPFFGLFSLFLAKLSLARLMPFMDMVSTSERRGNVTRH